MTICTECSYDCRGSSKYAVVVIGGFPDHLSRLLRDLGLRDSDGRLRTRPAAEVWSPLEYEVWSPLEYMAHTADAIAWYAGRMNRVLNEDRPALDPFDWDAHTATQRYNERRLTDVITTIRATCASLAAVLETVTVAAWRRGGIGSDGSPSTVAQLAARAGHEAQHHLRDIALGLDAPGRVQIRDDKPGQIT